MQFFVRNYAGSKENVGRATDVRSSLTACGSDTVGTERLGGAMRAKRCQRCFLASMYVVLWHGTGPDQGGRLA